MLDPREAEEAFVEDLMANQPAKVESFSYYIVKSYIDSTTPFPQKNWASSSTSSERTTNL